MAMRTARICLEGWLPKEGCSSGCPSRRGNVNAPLSYKNQMRCHWPIQQQVAGFCRNLRVAAYHSPSIGAEWG